MPCGEVSPDSRVVIVAVPDLPGCSSLTRPRLGWLTSRSPAGVHASIRASGTRAQAWAVQPAGMVSVRGVDSAPPFSPAGTASVTADADGAGAGAEARETGVPGSWPEEPEEPAQDATAASAAAVSSAKGKRRNRAVMSHHPSSQSGGACAHAVVTGLTPLHGRWPAGPGSPAARLVTEPFQAGGSAARIFAA